MIDGQQGPTEFITERTRVLAQARSNSLRNERGCSPRPDRIHYGTNADGRAEKIARSAGAGVKGTSRCGRITVSWYTKDEEEAALKRWKAVKA
jgi:hypothetical protein